MGESGALYQYEPLSSAIGQVKISRAKSIDDFDTKEWSVEVGIEPGDGQVKVLERNGHADFCLVGQSGEPGHCLLSLSTKDGSKPSWYQDNSSFIEVNGVIIASDADNNLTAYDEQGRRLWDQARASGALHVMGDALLVSENEAAAVERLDPRTGQSMWRADWYAGYFTGFQQDGKTVVAYTHPAFHAGVADLATGSVNLTEYPVEEPPRTMFRTAMVISSSSTARASRSSCPRSGPENREFAGPRASTHTGRWSSATRDSCSATPTSSRS